MKQLLFKEDDYAVTYERTPEIDKEIVDLLICNFRYHRCSCPESVAINEDLQCEGSSILADFAEVLKLGEN